MREHEQEVRVERSRHATVGIVLAGGGSTRLAGLAQTPIGGKAGFLFQGRTFLECVVTAVAAEVGRTIVVAAPGQTLPAFDGVTVARDLAPGSGPLAGIRDGLRAALAADHSGTPTPLLAVVASCDLPLLRPEVVRLLVADAHAHRQVLTSVMRVELLSRIEAWLATGRRDLRGLVDEIAQDDPRHIRAVTEAEVAAVDPMLESFVDIDTPDDLERLQSR
jgi:molybdopterin-guanine dinucleotide biosynthesis protein A